jgi:hypothetical protein
MIFYKYRGNSDFTNSIFTKKKVWLADAAHLNDPFECTIQEIAKEYIDEQVKEMKMGHIMGFVQSAINSIKQRSDFYGLSVKQTKQFLNKFKAKLTLEEKYTTTREFIYRKVGREISNPELTYANFDEQLNKVGIFSMTETCENQVMWAHYGDESRGVALGFENTLETKLASPVHFLKVNYSDDLPAFNREGFLVETSFYIQGSNTQKIVFHDPTLQAAISTKPICWDYEKEWRYVEEFAGSYPYPGTLKELVFGLKCSEVKRKEYIKLLNSSGHKNIKLFEIIKLPNSNQIKKIKY